MERIHDLRKAKNQGGVVVILDMTPSNVMYDDLRLVWRRHWHTLNNTTKRVVVREVVLISQRASW